MTGGIFIILDDIAVLMDDAAAVTKIAVKKTVPILGDDLAVGAEQSAGFHASRELPVLWAITKGSFKNKLILLPIVFLFSFLAPWLIHYFLIAGGLYLAYEGAEKVYEVIEKRFFNTSSANEKQRKVIDEKAKIKSAIVTDFILSIEIIVLALGAVMNQTFIIQVIAVSSVAIIATIGVYGTVALLVRIDDVGFYMMEHSEQNSLKEKFGKLLISSLPKVINILTVVGTVAMFMVAGGIFIHNIEFFHYFYIEYLLFLNSLLFEILLGLIIGLIIFSIKNSKFKELK